MGTDKKKVVLAYSGGLDTICLHKVDTGKV